MSVCPNTAAELQRARLIVETARKAGLDPLTALPSGGFESMRALLDHVRADLDTPDLGLDV